MVNTVSGSGVHNYKSITTMDGQTKNGVESVPTAMSSFAHTNNNTHDGHTRQQKEEYKKKNKQTLHTHKKNYPVSPG